MGFAWLKTLTALVLIATLADLLTPGKMRAYARLVTGLLLMWALLQPVAALVMGGVPDTLTLQTLLDGMEGLQ